MCTARPSPASTHVHRVRTSDPNEPLPAPVSTAPANSQAAGARVAEATASRAIPAPATTVAGRITRDCPSRSTRASRRPR